MEVRVDVTNSENELYCVAYFLMVARTISTNKGIKVPQLQPESIPNKNKVFTVKNSQLRMNLGKRRQQQRIKLRNSSVFKHPPNSEESKELHSIFLKSIQENSEEEVINLGGTRVEKINLKHRQDRNIHGKVFGGYVMRESLELAVVCAYKIGAGKMPLIYHIDDVNFILPIDVGKSFLNLKINFNFFKRRCCSICGLSNLYSRKSSKCEG